MRKIMTIVLIGVLAGALVSGPALAQDQATSTKAQLQAWDRCVGKNAQDYADMFGVISMDADKLDKAVEDCWEEEYKYQEIVKQNPDLSDGTMNELVAARKAEIRNKWLAHYTKGKAGIKRISH